MALVLSVVLDGSLLTSSFKLYLPLAYDPTQVKTKLALAPVEYSQPVVRTTNLTLLFSEDGPSTLTLNGSGGVKVGGAAQIIGDAYVVAGSGGVQVGGSAVDDSYTVDIFTEYGRGGAKVTGVAPVAFTWREFYPSGGAKVGGAAIVSGTGDVVVVAGNSLGVTLPAITSSFTADQVVNGLSVKLPKLKVVVGGLPGIVGTLGAALPTLRTAFVGGTQRLAAKLPALTTQFTGHTSTVATLGTELPQPRATFTGVIGASGVLHATLPRVRTQIVGLVGTIASLRAELPALTVSHTGLVGSIANLAIELLVPSVALGAHQRITGSLAIALPRLWTELRAEQTVEQILTLVVNTLSNSTVEYDQYPFNSFAEIDGKYYAAGPSGLYQIETGDTDGVLPIQAKLSTGQISFGSEYLKRLSDFYVGMRSEGDITLRVFVDERDPFEYTLRPLDVATLKQRRCAIGKGLRGKYWRFELENVDGCNYDLDTMNVAAEPMSRRI
jgi:hypothetical protein